MRLIHKFLNSGKTPTRLQIIDTAWQNENPDNKALNADGTYSLYPDPTGKGMNVGPGLFVGKAIEDKPRYTREELDERAYLLGIEGLASIGKSFNETYGTKDFPTPWDTVSVAPKLLMLDTRYLNHRLPQSSWPSLYDAVATGDWGEALRQTRSYYKDTNKRIHYDNDRVRRRAESLFPGMFDVFFKKNLRQLPTVKPKKK